MGFVIQDSTTASVLDQLNKRFAPNELNEIAALQKAFKIFSPKHTLRQSFALLGIVPADAAERQRWYYFLDSQLPTYPSDLLDVNGHDRVVQALRDAFEATHPLPVNFRVHLKADDPRVTQVQGRAIIYSFVQYSIISIPTVPGRLVREQVAEVVRKRRAAKSKKSKK
jgi:hypothetical protein